MNKFQAKIKAKKLAKQVANENTTAKQLKDLEKHYYEELIKDKTKVAYKRNKHFEAEL